MLVEGGEERNGKLRKLPSDRCSVIQEVRKSPARSNGEAMESGPGKNVKGLK